MNRITKNIWGRTYELEVTYDCYSNEDVLTIQRETVERFTNLNLEEGRSLELVKEYCLSANKDEIGTADIDNIFRYVIPKYLYVPRNEEKRMIAIMCNYRFDPEHGIAILFENESVAKITSQDYVL